VDKDLEAYIRSGSTPYEWKRVKVRPKPAGRANRAAGASRFYGLTRRDSKTALDIKIKYRGGAESWWLIETRGRTAAFPGWMGLDDVMAEVNRSPSFFDR
jgi:hypothetical protein